MSKGSDVSNRSMGEDGHLAAELRVLSKALQDSHVDQSLHHQVVWLVQQYRNAVEVIERKAHFLSQDITGAAQSLVQTSASCGGFSKRFERGGIFYKPTLDAHWLSGAIFSRYMATGGPQGCLGYPVMDEVATESPHGCYAHFEHGSIYSSAGNGTHEIAGPIRAQWLEIGGHSSVLGHPRSGEKTSEDGSGRFQDFEDGAMYWHADTGAHCLYGSILQKWRSLGATRSFLGYPVLNQEESFARLQRGTLQRGEHTPFAVADTRIIDLGTLHTDAGGAVCAHAKLTISSNGAWRYQGDMRTTDTTSCTASIASVFLFTPSVGTSSPVFLEIGDVEGLRETGSSQRHSWDKSGASEVIQTHWAEVRHAPVRTLFKVNLGSDALLKMLEPLAAGPIMLASASNPNSAEKSCGFYRHTYYHPHTHQVASELGVVFVDRSEACPHRTQLS